MFARARSFLCTVLAPPILKQTPVRSALLPIVMDGKRSLCSIPDVKVEHNLESQEFHIEFPDCRAFLRYEKEGHLFKIMHTEVPEKMGGRGLGKVLAKAALIYIQDHNYRPEIHCEFVQHYVETYEPKYLQYIVINKE